MLVVGGAGYVGSIVARQLLDDGYEVIVLDALLYGGDGLESLDGRPGFELIVGDTRETAVVREAVGRAGAVIHLGEIVGDAACDLDPAITRSVNLLATAELAAIAAEAGVTQFFYASSCSVYGATDDIAYEDGPLNPVSLYGQLKVQAEESVLSNASPWFHPTVFRLATAFGPSPRPRFDLVVNYLAGRAAIEGSIVIHGGGQWRPFVHVADIAELLVRTLALPPSRVSGETFNVGSNAQNHTIAGVAEIIRQHLPLTDVVFGERPDHRNYRVAFDKVADVLQFSPSRSVATGVSEIVQGIQDGDIADFTSAGYSNVRALVEAAGRRRLWRADLGDGDPTRPFRPRDVETRPRSTRDREEDAESVGS